MPGSRGKRFVVLALLAVALVNPALLAQVARPAGASQTSQRLARRAFRRSRRLWLAHAGPTHVQKRTAVSTGRGPAANEFGAALPASGFAAPVPAPAETEAVACGPAAGASVPRYLLYRTLLI